MIAKVGETWEIPFKQGAKKGVAVIELSDPLFAEESFFEELVEMVLSSYKGKDVSVIWSGGIKVEAVPDHLLNEVFFDKFEVTYPYIVPLVAKVKLIAK